MIIGKETILTRDYELPLNAFRRFGVSRKLWSSTQLRHTEVRSY